MNPWNLSALTLAVALGLIAGGGSRAGIPNSHVSGALRSLEQAKRHLEALPRTDERDYTQEAIRAVEDLQK